MSFAPRVRLGKVLALTAFASLPLALAWLVPSCGTKAINVEACRAIEYARCDGLLSCPTGMRGGYARAEQAEACRLFYRDDCLHGIGNTKPEYGANSDPAECVKAIQATAACARAGATTLEGCAGAPLANGEAPGALDPCVLLSQGPIEKLAACKFVAAVPDPVDGGADAQSAASGSSSSSSGGGAGGASASSASGAGGASASSSSASGAGGGSASSSSASGAGGASASSSSAAGGGSGPADAATD